MSMLMEGELEETGSIEDDFVVLLQKFFMEISNFVKSKKDVHMSLQPAHSCEAEVKCTLKKDFSLKSRLVNR